MPGSFAESLPAQRKLPLRIRPDLEIHSLEFGGRRYWGVKDPLSLRYFQLRDEEYSVLRMLDGQRSLEEIKLQIERQFSPRRVTTRQLLGFIRTLHDESLLVADTPGQAAELLARHGRKKRLALQRAMTNLLAIRFRGIDPERFLNWLSPRCRWMFSPACRVCCAILVLTALALALVRFGPLQAKLPQFHEFLTGQNAFWLAVAVAVAKLLHELGHALTCKHYGGECHEMGVMLLAFTPCVYCNVSDAWMLPDKWHRMAIGAAGICVEFVLAAICTLLWWFSEPGLLNSLCLNLMFVSSISTLVFNGNPLLRYDAYYVLSDFVEVPNLRQGAMAVLQDGLARWFLGLDLYSDRLLPEKGRRWLAAYAVASIVYGWIVTLAVLWFFGELLKPYHLEVLAYAMGLVVVGAVLAVPLVRFASFLSDPFRNRFVKWRQFFFRGGFAAVALVVLFAIPWPYRIEAPVTIRPAGAQPVYATVAGRLVSSVRDGDVVASGQELAKLENREVQIEVARLTAERNQQRLYIANLERRQISDDQAGLLLPVARKSLEDIEERLQQRTIDQRRLVLRAPQAGTVLPPPARARQVAAGELAAWSGTPLDPWNVGASLEPGTLLCLVGDPDRLEAALVIDQAGIDLVRKDQRVRIQLDELPGQLLWGTVTEIAVLDLKVAPRELAASGDLSTRPDEAGIHRPRSTSYQARVTLDRPGAPVLLGTSGDAKVHVAPKSWGKRLYRYLRRTFRFEI